MGRFAVSEMPSCALKVKFCVVVPQKVLSQTAQLISEISSYTPGPGNMTLIDASYTLSPTSLWKG